MPNVLDHTFPSPYLIPHHQSLPIIILQLVISSRYFWPTQSHSFVLSPNWPWCLEFNSRFLWFLIINKISKSAEEWHYSQRPKDHFWHEGSCWDWEWMEGGYWLCDVNASLKISENSRRMTGWNISVSSRIWWNIFSVSFACLKYVKFIWKKMLH